MDEKVELRIMENRNTSMNNTDHVNNSDVRRCTRSCLSLFPKYVTGNVSSLSNWTKSKSPFIKFPFYFLRALGTPMFLNNPISGLIILVGLYLGDPWIATTGCICCAVALITSFLLEQDDGLSEAGVTSFHGLLSGLLVPIFIDRPAWHWPTTVAVAGIGILSVYVGNGLGTIFGHLNLPAFNLSFNVCSLVFIAATGTENHFLPMKKIPPLLPNETFSNSFLDLKEIGLGTLKGTGQIYGIESPVTSVALIIATFIASPISCLQMVLSALVSVGTAMLLAVPPKEIYKGLWGYNGILACMSVGGYWRVFTAKNQILSLFCAVFATYLQGAMGRVFATWDLPVLGLPYALTSTIFLSFATSRCKGYARQPLNDITYPEEHWRQYKEEIRNSKIE